MFLAGAVEVRPSPLRPIAAWAGAAAINAKTKSTQLYLTVTLP